jgi:hypothetical protein
VLVLRIESGGVAATSGLAVGDVLVRVDGEPVRDPSALSFGALPQSLEVVRDGTRRVLRVAQPEGAPGSPKARAGTTEERREIEREIAGLKKRLAELERRLARWNPVE